MPRLLRLLVALLVLLGLTPGGFELVENLEHIAHDGHFAHADDHVEEADHGDAGDEHGCTPMMHTCGCHTSANALLGGSLAELLMPESQPEQSPLARDDRPLARATAPPTPPPNA